MEELISVIVPVYKVEQYLDRCIKSLVEQTYSNIEIIIVDDGSPDNCPMMCDKWKKEDTRIRVIHKKNGGLSDARNAGLEVAKGVYVAFVDSDDYVDMQYIEILYYMMKRTNADLVACNCEIVKQEQSCKPRKKKIVTNIKEKELKEITTTTIGVNAWNKLYKRTLFEHIRFPVGKIHEDAGIWWKIVYYASKVVAVEEKLYFYCQNPESIMHTAFTMKHMDLVDVLFSQYKEFKHLNEHEYACRILRACLDSYPLLYLNLKKGQDFNKANRKSFFQSYRRSLGESLKEQELDVKMKLKHLLYCYCPIFIECLYQRRHIDVINVK